MTADAALQKKRLTAMLAIDAVCFVLAGVAIYAAVSLKMGWAKPVFIAAIAVGLGAQFWFILGWMRAARGQGASS
jgi:hypothetical protein